MATLPAAASADKAPTVLVIPADDLGFPGLSCHGSEIQTPNIDRLRSGGVKFSAFYNSARCCPSRAALITGLHPHQAGIGSFATAKPRNSWAPAYAWHLLPNAATIPEILGEAGHSTWMVVHGYRATAFPGPAWSGPCW
jgi:arylsulfatase A-like enzyme